jgi:hypothetical protein
MLETFSLFSPLDIVLGIITTALIIIKGTAIVHPNCFLLFHYQRRIFPLVFVGAAVDGRGSCGGTGSANGAVIPGLPGISVVSSECSSGRIFLIVTGRFGRVLLSQVAL